MFKLFFTACFILSSYCYSQVDPEELDHVPPEVREKLLEVINDAREKAVLLEEKADSDKKAVTPKVPEQKKLVPFDREKALKLIKELGANHYKIRKNAKIELTKMGYPVIPVLKEQLVQSEDPEVTENIKEIIAKLTKRLHFNQLNDKQKAIAKLEFKQGAVGSPKVKGEYFNKDDHFIIEIGLTRMVFEGEIQQISGRHRRSVNMTLDGRSGGGGSSSSNGFKIYNYSYQNGVGYWTVCGHSFTVSNYELEIRKEKLNLRTEQPQIIYFDKNGKPIGILDLK